MDWHKARAAAEYILIAVVLVALLFQFQHAVNNRLQSTQQPIKETNMNDYTKLLQPYRQRIEGIFADLQGTLSMIDDNADMPDAVFTDGYSMGETLAMQLVETRKAFDAVLNDLNVAVVDYAKQARIDAD